jgi:hypothetical protein
VWAALSLALAGYLAARLLGPDKTVFLPGATTSGHHQIELACGVCHQDAFGGGPVLQDACIDCHGAELAAANDSHPQTKFTDPRNADRLRDIDARQCIACHVEHRPQITGVMGVTLPVDLCISCHAGIGEERPTHAGLDHMTCQTAGCHNFHDNRALYEDFLLRHVGEAPLRTTPRRPQPVLPVAGDDLQALRLAQLDAPADRAQDAAITADWAHSAHARGGVNCTACHAPAGVPWQTRPGTAVCAECHQPQVQGFLAGKHGMRLAQDLPAMTPAQARLPMHAEAAHSELSCASCHRPHAYDTAQAAVQACLGCHDDTHTRAYEGSPHHRLWLAEQAGEAPPGSGVSCAGCHMPLRTYTDAQGKRTHTEHNQNATLRPNEKMLRPVCLNCHGLPFALDALADPALIGRNFRGQPAQHVRSVEMAQENLERDRRRRAAEQ